MPAKRKRGQLSGVKIGNVTGGISSSIIAGRDVQDTRIANSQVSASLDEGPTLADFQRLLNSIQQELGNILENEGTLRSRAPAAAKSIASVKKDIEDAAKKAHSASTLRPEQAKSMQRKLKGAAGRLGSVLDETKGLADKAGAAAASLKPLLETLKALTEKIALAALWVAKLWQVAGHQ